MPRREVARVCKKGGRLGLCTWRPGGTIEEWFQVMRPYVPPPPATPPPSPFEWGKPERLRELLGGTFDLEFEEGVTTLQMPNGARLHCLHGEVLGRGWSSHATRVPRYDWDAKVSAHCARLKFGRKLPVTLQDVWTGNPKVGSFTPRHCRRSRC